MYIDKGLYIYSMQRYMERGRESVISAQPVESLDEKQIALVWEDPHA